MTINTLRELYAFNRWAADKTLEIADSLSAEQLDRSFEMGPGSTRHALHHIWAAERVWLDRWTNGGAPRFVQPEAALPIAELRKRYQATAAERDEFLAKQTDAKLAEPLTVTNTKGETYSLPLGGQMLHVVNHGIHHRAQIVNMVRHAGGPVPRPGLDYIFYRLEKIKDPPPTLDLKSIRAYEAHADWATRKLLAIAATLTDAQLTKPFEMGLGNLRKTLCHLVQAEEWWQANWTTGPAGAFPAADDKISIAELIRRFDAAWAARDRFVGTLKDNDLSRPVITKPRPDLTFQFPLGVTLVQLCGHATHHRAQMLNMLRHVGAKPPVLDLVLWLREV